MTDKKAEQIISRKKLARLLGCSETTLWRRVRKGQVPPPFRLGSGSIGWLESTIVEWQQSLTTDRA